MLCLIDWFGLFHSLLLMKLIMMEKVGISSIDESDG